MPPIQPSAGVQTKIYTITNSDLVGSIVLDIPAYKILSFFAKSDALFNGFAEVQTEYEDGSFFEAFGLQNPNERFYADELKFFTFGSSGGVIDPSSPFTKYPYHLRVKIDTQATQGTYMIEVNYL